MKTKTKSIERQNAPLTQEYRINQKIVTVGSNGDDQLVMNIGSADKTLGYSDSFDEPYGILSNCSLTDEVNEGRINRNWFKYCHHVQAHETYWLSGEAHAQSRIPCWPGVNPQHYEIVSCEDYPWIRKHKKLMKQLIAAENQSQQEYDLDIALSRAYEYMLPQVDEVSGEMSLPVFIAELRDFRSLVRSIRYTLSYGLIPTIKMMARYTKRNLKYMTPKSALRDLAQQSGEARLSLKFALEPLVRDLETMVLSFNQMNDFLKKWNKAAATHKVWTRSYNLKDYIDPQCIGRISPSQIDSYLADFQASVRCTMQTEHQVSGYAHLGFIPQTIEYKGFRRLQYLFDLYGGGDGISIVWNIVPFSFLVDYVLSVDEALSQFSKNMTTLPIQPAYFGYSLKKVIYSSGHTTALEPVTNNHWEKFGRASGAYALTSYTRERVPLPNIGEGFLGFLHPEELHWEIPSLTQWFNLSALITVLYGGR